MTQDDRGIGTTVATVADPEPTRAQPSPQPATKPAKRPYLYQIDLFRILTFACVIMVHVVSGSAGPEDVVSNGLQVLLHFTREAFFALTGFVLIYQYMNRPVSAVAFWRRRFTLIGIPYLAWSVFYWAYSIYLNVYPGESFGRSLWRLVFEIATGQAWYQMYFLLVSMQVYLLFPLLMKLLRATEGHHRWVLAVSAVLQLAFLYWWVNPPTLSGTAASLWVHLYIWVFPYQFYILLGAIAAWHFEAMERIVRRFGVWFVVGAVVTTVLAELDYLRSTHLGMPPSTASDIFLPHLMAFFILTIAGQYALCTWWNAHRRDGSFVSRAVTWGSDRSFAVFLLHPLALQLIAPYIIPMQHPLGIYWTMAVVYIWVVAISLVLAEFVRRIPGSMWLTGRPMVRTDFSPLVRRFRTV